MGRVGKVDNARNLRGDIVERQCGDKADYAFRCGLGNDGQVGLSHLVQIGQTVAAPAQRLEVARIAHGIEHARLNALANGLCGA